MTQENLIKMSLTPNLAHQFFSIIGEITDDFRLRISKDGWNVSVVDPANVAMININLPSDNFLNYDYYFDGNWTSSIDGHLTGVQEDNTAFGIDVQEINRFIGTETNKKDIIPGTMYAPISFEFSSAPEKYAQRKGRKFLLELKQGMFSRKLLLIPESEIRKAPKDLKLSFLNYKVLFDANELRIIIKKCIEFRDYIRLHIERKENDMWFTAEAYDDDFGLPWIATKQIHTWQALRDNASDSSCSLFLGDYLRDMTEVIASASRTVWLHLGQDNPCKLMFHLGRTGYCEYMQAPSKDYMNQ